MRRCLQTKCMFNNSPMCPRCDSCNCAPNLIDEDCVTCHNCERDDGSMRGSSGFRKGNTIAIFDKGKVLVMDVKKAEEQILREID